MAPKLAPTQGRQRETGERKQATPDGQAAGPICKGTCRQGLVSAATRRTDFHAHQPDSSVYVETPAGLSHVQMGSAADCSHKSGVLENSAGRMCIPRWGGGGAKELPNAWVPLAGQPVVTTLRQQQTKGMETLRVKLKWRLSEPKSIKEDTAIQWGESCPVGWVGISVRETWGETLSQQKEQECGQGLRNFPSGAAPGIDKSPRWP